MLDNSGAHMTQAAGDAVSNHRGTHRLADNQTETRTAGPRERLRLDIAGSGTTGRNMHDDVPPPDSPAVSHRPGELGTMMQPVRLRQHLGVRPRNG